MANAVMVATVPNLAKGDDWVEIKRTGVALVELNDEVVEVSLAGQPTKIGSLRFFLCPGCGRRCRDLFCRGDKLGCRKCLHVLHPDQQLGSSRWDQQVVRPARQVERIEHQLSRQGLDRNHRRRLRRRRQRLLMQVEQELAQRQLDQIAAAALADLPALLERPA